MSNHNDQSASHGDTRDARTDAGGRQSSTTSTVIYRHLGHEPFATYRSKVEGLCEEIWPDLKPDAFTVNRRDGSDNTRIIKITTDLSQKIQPLWLRCLNGDLAVAGYREWVDPPDRNHFTMRIPRKDNPWFTYELAMEAWATTEAKVPGRKTVNFGLSYDNKVGKPYAVQRSVHGHTLENTFHDMDFNQRLLIARDLGKAMAAMTRLKNSSPAPGILDPESYRKHGWVKNKVQVLQLDVPFRGVYQTTAQAQAFPSRPQTTISFLKTQISRQREYDLLRGYRGDFWRGAEQVAEHIDDMGFFNDRYCITHLDLGPHNIVCRSEPREGRTNIRAIDDWDIAIFAPMWLSLTPPSWLWTSEDEDPEEAKADEFPSDPRLRRIRDTFDAQFKELGWAYLYSPLARIARGICRLAILSIHSKEDYEALNQILIEWNVSFPERKVRLLWDPEDVYANNVPPPTE